MMSQLPWAFVSFFLFLAMVGCQGVGAASEVGPKGDLHQPSAVAAVDKMDEQGGGDGSQGVSQGSELIPEPLPLRKPTAMHKRLYPRWYQAYVYKTPSFNQMARPVGERKRFQPFHPMARFRGLSMGSGSSGSGRYHGAFDMPLSDQPGHPVPSAPNAQPSPKYNPEDNIMEEEEEVEEQDEDALRAGEILQYLRSIASDRGLSGNTKSFRFGISRRK